MRSTHRWRDDDPGNDDDEPMPLIELTGDLDDVGTVEQLTEDETESSPGRRSAPRSLPRRYLVAGAVALLAIGFAGGMVVQRASAPVPADDAAATASTTQIPVRAPEFVVPSADTSTCRYVDGYGAVGITTVCTGTLYSIHPITHGWQLTLTLAHGATIGIEADDGTAIDGFPSLGAVSVGTTLVVSGHAGQDGTLHATAITFA